MRIDKLFKVLVVGGSVLTAGCGDAPRGPSTGEVVAAGEAGVAADVAAVRDTSVDVSTVRDAAARADGVSSWMSWFVDPAEEDAGPADVGAADAGAAEDTAADARGDAGADGGVFAWLSWV